MRRPGMNDSASNSYVGRFAPTPSGPLHQGSLVAALGSFLDARQSVGRWLLRIDDLDPPREVAGATDTILRQLDRHGLHWDGPVFHQRDRAPAYRQALEQLRRQHPAAVFACDCSRARLGGQGMRRGAGGMPLYPGYCRDRDRVPEPYAWRLRAEGRVGFHDRVQGDYAQRLEDAVGDFVLRRRDGLFAYQLAVVVDDADQGVNQVVRGADLIDNTPRQILVQRHLGIPTPAYAHLPVARNAAGDKLSKQTHAPPLDRPGGLGIAARVPGLGARRMADRPGAPGSPTRPPDLTLLLPFVTFC